jgi:predicted ATP-dependent endonuclease of OLD family
VEGATENSHFLCEHTFRFDIDRYGISIIECGGKGNLIIFSKVAKAFNIPYVVVADEDIKDISLISDPEKIKKAEAQNKDTKQKNDAFKAFVLQKFSLDDP